MTTHSFTVEAIWYDAIVNADYSTLSDLNFDRFCDWSRFTEGMEYTHVTRGLGEEGTLEFHFKEV